MVTTQRRKIVTRYTGDKATLHRRIARGTVAARPGYVFAVFTTGLHKGYALELPLSEFKRGDRYATALPEAEYISEDR